MTYKQLNAALAEYVTHPLKMAYVYIAGALMDFGSSLFTMPPGFHETNPFARHEDGSFWPAHALMTGGIDTLEYVVLSTIFYLAGGIVGKKWAGFMAGLPWLYLAYVHIEAAEHNLLLRLHLFVPMPFGF